MADRRGVIFDMDGVLLLSAEAHWRAWQDTAAAFGLPLSRDRFDAFHGHRTVDIGARLLGEGAPPDLLAEVAAHKERAFRAAIGADVPLAPGCRELLQQLRARGAALALGSSATLEDVDLVLDGGGLRPFFAAVVHAGMVQRGKPAADVFERAAALLGLPARRCVVVEDAPAGVQAARAARMEVVCVASTHAAAELRRAGAARVAEALAELPLAWLLP